MGIIAELKLPSPPRKHHPLKIEKELVIWCREGEDGSVTAKYMYSQLLSKNAGLA